MAYDTAPLIAGSDTNVSGRFPGWFVQAALFCVFVTTDVGKVMAFSWAIRGTAVQSQTIVVVNSAMSILVGTLLTSKDGVKGIRAAFDPVAIARFGFVAFLFCINQTLGALQYTALSPGTAKVLGQIRLPFLAFGSRWVLRRVYSLWQWVGLMAITITAIAFAEVKAGEAASADGDLFFGYGCSILASLATVTAGLLSERFLKQHKNTPFYTQKVQLECGGIVFATAMLWFMPWYADVMDLSVKDSLVFDNPRTTYQCAHGLKTVWGEAAFGAAPEGCTHVETFDGSFFDGWCLATCVCLLMSMAQSWMAGYLAKAMSQVAKQIGQCASLLLCYFLGDCFLFRRASLDPTLSLIACAVVCSMALYVRAPSPATSADK
eukprot:TRINITY_DN80585_c0_g1_i1.p1 TRINITY_DN80585_c0_g1~~TRINITY_DN80585_c0_g1_i1.p1  ORF type:complete len:377 (-),score=74.63 TRINITY_DN80585_c0_g1_i1:23-1153(-)